MNHSVKIPQRTYTEGLPCHKFILRQLTTTNEGKTFTKNYVSTLIGAGMSHAEIETSLSFLSGIASRLAGSYQFQVWENCIEGFDLIDSISMDNSIATYKNCRQYYKTFDVKTGACALCPLATAYKNMRMGAESQVIRFCLENRKNLDYVIQKGITAELFTAVVDVTEHKAAADKPCLYPFFKRSFEALLTEDYVKDIFEDGVDYDVVLEKYHTSKVARYGNITKDCSTTVNTLCAVMISEYLPAIACESTQIDAFLEELSPSISATAPLSSLLNNESAGADGVPISEHCNLGLGTLKDFYNTDTGRRKKKKAKKSSSDSVEGNFRVIDMEKILSSLDVESEDTNMPTGAEKSVRDVASEETVSSAVVSEQEESTDGSAPKPDGISERLLPVRYKPCPVGEALSSSSEHEAPVITITEIEVPEHCVYTDTDSLVMVPTVDKEELETFSLNLDKDNSKLLTMFESYMLKDKRLSLELVVAKDTWCLLLYSPKMHAYFHTYFKNTAAGEIVKELLSYPSIQKVCYSPYMLVSFLARLNIRVKNLWSLYSMSAITNPAHRLPMEDVLLQMGAKKAVGGVTVPAEGDIESVPLLYMHCYHNLFSWHKKSLLKKGLYLNYEERNTFDLVLGLFYQQALYATETQFLFKLHGAGNYAFSGEVPTSFREAGKVFGIELRHSVVQPSHLIVQLLCDMYNAGLLDKRKVMVLSICDNRFCYYVADTDREYMDMKLNQLLLKYMKKNELRGLEYFKKELHNSAWMNELN